MLFTSQQEPMSKLLNKGVSDRFEMNHCGSQQPKVGLICVLEAPKYPEGPSTQYLRFLVPKTILLMVFGTRDLKYWVLGPSR